MNATMGVGESGHEFEARGLHLTRSLHDPSGAQGSLMILGRERDAVFISHDAINAYEFTIDRTKQKAIKDAEKLAQLIGELSKDKSNDLRTMTGWFVTREEPTADQRTAVQSTAKKFGLQINAVSISRLYARICDSETYLQIRDKAPFGSTSLTGNPNGKIVNVPIRVVSDSGEETDLEFLTNSLLRARRELVIGDFGTGKSHALRDIYSKLRKNHFKQGHLSPFPVHINLRDCAGLKTPAEILRRHADEIGFDNANGLITAWRAGMCILLLDGFDEIVPRRWLGNAADLRTVRWEALAPFRRLIEETPNNSGIIIAGRAHYFSQRREMAAALGFTVYETFEIPEFDEAQLAEFLKQSEADWSLPDWVPARPLFLSYLARSNEKGEYAGSAVSITSTPAAGWRKFLSEISLREAKILTSVRPETIEKIIARVATLARGGASTTGPLSEEQLSQAFVSINGFQPDEEGQQVLLRLPGLTSSPESRGVEMRSFADERLAEAAYGIDLSTFILDPHHEAHPLAGPATWVNASDGLGTQVAAEILMSENYSAGLVKAALAKRQNADRYDAVLADLVNVVASMPPDGPRVHDQFLVSGVAFAELTISDHPVFDATTFSHCMIERLDVSGIDDESPMPRLQECLVSRILGVSALPKWLDHKFVGTEIENFDSSTQTTNGILHLDIDLESRIALTVLRKLFLQSGSGRKTGALSRGIDPKDRVIVSPVLAELVSQGWISKEGSGNKEFYIGLKSRRSDAKKALDSPSDFRLK